MVPRPLDFMKFIFESYSLGLKKYGDILVFVKFENNWMIRLGKHSHKGK